jgi:hypothetical protein
MSVNESIHVQLIHAVNRLVLLIKKIEQEPCVRLNYEDSFMVSKATELEQKAKTNCKNLGISIEVP